MDNKDTMKKDYDKYTQRLRDLAKASGLSQRELSEITGVPNSTIACAMLGGGAGMAHSSYEKLVKACKKKIVENQELLRRIETGL